MYQYTWDSRLNHGTKHRQRVNIGATVVPRQAIDMNTYKYVATNKNMYKQSMIQMV